MVERGDNFELAWDARGWHADEMPGRLVAVMLVILMNERAVR